MKIEIWSDIMCPFCYIGKRKFETALAQFPNKDEVEIEWKSFQLMPNLQTQPGRDINEFLAREKGMPLEQAKSLSKQVVAIAKQVGLEYDFENLVPSNTFNAHQFLHFAKKFGKQNEAEEAVFHAHFIEAKNIDSLPTLLQIADSIGLDSTLLETQINQNLFADAVNADITEAAQLGVRGVPFFVFDRKQAVSGAQDPQVFLELLEKTFAVWKQHRETKLGVIDGEVCSTDGNCN